MIHFEKVRIIGPQEWAAKIPEWAFKGGCRKDVEAFDVQLQQKKPERGDVVPLPWIAAGPMKCKMRTLGHRKIQGMMILLQRSGVSSPSWPNWKPKAKETRRKPRRRRSIRDPLRSQGERRRKSARGVQIHPPEAVQREEKTSRKRRSQRRIRRRHQEEEKARRQRFRRHCGQEGQEEES